MRPALLRSSVVVALLLLLASPAWGQSAAATRPPLALVSIIDVKPDLLSEFGELQAQNMAAQQKGGLAWRETWNTATLGSPYQVAVLTPLAAFAQLDGQSFVIKGVGPEAARTINERARRMIVSQRIWALQARPDLGFGARPAEFKLAIVTTITVAPGRSADWENLLKTEVVPALKKLGKPYYGVSQVVYGGNTNDYVTMIPIDDFGELDKGHPLAVSLGPDAYAKFNQRLTGIVQNIERQIFRYNAALSYRPAAATPSARP